MSFIGIVTNAKNELCMSKIFKQNFQKEEIIFITDKNIENMKNIHFETIVIDTNMNHIEELKWILSNTKYVILNADGILEPDIFEDLNLVVISYGFQSKATFTVSSVEETNIIICLQRIMRTINNLIYEPQEFEVKKEKDVDIHAIICTQILLLFYEKIQILAK